MLHQIPELLTDCTENSNKSQGHDVQMKNRRKIQLKLTDNLTVLSGERQTQVDAFNGPMKGLKPFLFESK